MLIVSPSLTLSPLCVGTELKISSFLEVGLEAGAFSLPPVLFSLPQLTENNIKENTTINNVNDR